MGASPGPDEGPEQRGAPALFFSRSDLPGLRKFARQGEANVIYKRILARAEQMCRSGSNEYVDPNRAGTASGHSLSYWLETLGLAYQLTREERFGEHGAAVMESACRAEFSESSRAMLMRAFAVGYDWLRSAMTDKQRRAVEQAARKHVLRMLAAAAKKPRWMPYHNYMGRDLGAGGCLAVALQGAYPQEAPAWIKEFEQYARLWLDKGFDAQGGYGEGTYYGIWGLSNWVLFAEALKRSGGSDLFAHPHLRMVPHFYAMNLLPGEKVFEARNDAYYLGMYDPMMLCLASEQKDSLAKWLWQRCGHSESPFVIVWGYLARDIEPSSPVESGEPLSEQFTGTGLCIFRTGWDAGDAMFALEAGPYRDITHTQADKGHFTFYALGHRWAIDSGYGNRQHRRSRDQAEAHSCVLVDGRGQALCGQGLGVNGKVVAYEDGPEFGYVLTDCTEAYNRGTAGKPGLGLKRALRGGLFLKPSHGAPAYAVVLDDIVRDDHIHRFTWLMHTDSLTRITVHDDGFTLNPSVIQQYIRTPDEPQLAYGPGACEWAFEVPKEHDYVLWAAVRVAGREVLTSDSFFVRVDDGQPRTWHLPGSRCRNWIWTRAVDRTNGKPFSYRLSAGRHKLKLQLRESGAQVAKVFLTPDRGLGPLSPTRVGGILLDATDAQVTAPMERAQKPQRPATPQMRVYVNAEAHVGYSYTSFGEHPRLHAWTTGVNPKLVCVLLPLAAHRKQPKVKFHRADDGLRIVVDWTSRRDEIRWAPGPLGKPTVHLSEATADTHAGAAGMGLGPLRQEVGEE